MSNLNRWIGIGNLTRDPEARSFATSRVVKIGLAVNDKRKGLNGELEDKTLFVDIDFWGKAGEVAEKYLKKGDKIVVEGKLELDTWTDKSTNEKRSKHKIRGENLYILSNVKSSSSETSEKVDSNGDDDIPF